MRGGMLTIYGTRQTFCDGLARREFLRIGGLGFTGLGLADLLRLRAEAGQSQAVVASASRPSVTSLMLFFSTRQSSVSLRRDESRVSLSFRRGQSEANWRDRIRPLATA